MNKLDLDKNTILRCRISAKKIADDIHGFINQHTTVSVERTVCRLLGIDGVDELDIPIPNRLVDEIYQAGNLGKGISVYIAAGLKLYDNSMARFISAFTAGEVRLSDLKLLSEQEAENILRSQFNKTLAKIKLNKGIRKELQDKYPGRETKLYVIVATGNIYEDVIQAKAAAAQGADIIAVIRSTGQSLLDYVPYGVTTEGYGGTYATQENFRIMRAALDEMTEKTQRYIQLVNYASGLCMPEIAAMAAVERLDILLNDSMYGIIFRDINMQRTFIDQYFSRLINAYAGIIINTGEDNYLTTADAVEEAHTVLASQFINEAFAKQARLPEELMGLGHAFEINPEIENSFLYEVAQAEMAREIFPNAPLK